MTLTQRPVLNQIDSFQNNITFLQSTQAIYSDLDWLRDYSIV